ILWSALLTAAGAALFQVDDSGRDAVPEAPAARDVASPRFGEDEDRPLAPAREDKPEAPSERPASSRFDETEREAAPAQEFAPPLREPERLTPPSIKRRYVVSDRETKSEKQIELRLSDGEIVRMLVTSNGAPGDDPDLETIRCSIEAAGQSVALWSLRRSADEPISQRRRGADSNVTTAGLTRASQLRDVQIETEGDVGMDSPERFDRLMQLLQKSAARLLTTGFDEESQWFRQVQRELQRRRRLIEVEKESDRLRDQLSDLEDEAQQLSRGEDRTRLAGGSRYERRPSRSAERDGSRDVEASELRQVADQLPARTANDWEREVRALRREVSELRRELEALRGTRGTVR
ncbi:MAG TPA: hypothetical protein VHB77_01645, partial [Planctomycetaceae bacterium]|nr:hypothetical protein [Planctomycetaceae bacterium]